MGTLITIGLWYLGICAVSICFFLLMVMYENWKAIKASPERLADVTPTTPEPLTSRVGEPSGELQREKVDSRP